MKYNGNREYDLDVFKMDVEKYVSELAEIYDFRKKDPNYKKIEHKLYIDFCMDELKKLVVKAAIEGFYAGRKSGLAVK